MKMKQVNVRFDGPSHHRALTYSAIRGVSLGRAVAELALYAMAPERLGATRPQVEAAITRLRSTMKLKGASDDGLS